MRQGETLHATESLWRATGRRTPARHPVAERVLREAAMDAETVWTLEAEGMPVRMRYRPDSVEAHLAVNLSWITSLHEVCLSGWWRTLPA
jgi:hypothetical protein